MWRNYNVHQVTTEPRQSVPNTNVAVFYPLRLNPPGDGLLSEPKVYYQAQLHLCLYYSLVATKSTGEFDSIYQNAMSSKFWKFADNSRVKTVGDYAMLELAVDSVMIRYLMPHLSQHTQLSNPFETDLDDCHLARAFEFVYFRTLFHLCALTEAYLQLIQGRSRAMMSIDSAKHLLTRSLNRQVKRISAGRIDEVVPDNPQPPTPLRQRNIMYNVEEDTDIGEKPLLKENLTIASGDDVIIASDDDVIIDNARAIKSLHVKRMKSWSININNYLRQGHDLELGDELTTVLKQLKYLLDPKKYSEDDVVYRHTHKRAYAATVLAEEIVRLTASTLHYGISSIHLDFKSVVNNVSVDFKYYPDVEDPNSEE